MKKSVRVAIATALGCVLATPVYSQGLEEIVITATRRAQSLEDVPISVSAVAGADIANGGFANMEDLSVFVPNLRMQNGFTGQSLYIRGIGTSTGNEAFEQAVGQFADGVYYGRDNLSLNSFFDLERVEVVRGPQPTFAGQSATAGAINAISRKPTDTLQGDVIASYGQQDETSIEAAVGGPLTDTIGARIAGRYYNLGDTGYRRLYDGHHMGTREDKAGRLFVTWTPNDVFDATFKYEHQDTFQDSTTGEWTRCDLNPATSYAHHAVTPGIPALCALDQLYTKPLVGNTDTLATLTKLDTAGGFLSVWDAIDYLNAQSGAQPGDANYWGDPNSPVSRNLAGVKEYSAGEPRKMTADIYSMVLDWQIGQYTVSSQTAYVTYDKEDWLDPDESSFAIFTDHRLENFKQKSEEIRITSPEDQKVSWMAGAYWQNHKLDTEIDIFMPWLFFGADPTWTDGNLANGEYQARSFGGDLFEDSTWKSLFLAATWNITDQWRFNFGGRFQDVSKQGDLIPTQALLPVGAMQYDPRFQGEAALHEPSNSSDWLPEVGLQWDATDGIMLYVKYAEAFKAGGYVMSPAIAGSLPDPFTYKPEHASGYEGGMKGRFFNNTLQLNLALFDTDYKDLQVTTFLSEEGRFITGNAAEAKSRGIEYDGRWAATDSFTLGFSGALLDAHYVDYPDATCDTLQTKLWALDHTSQCLLDASGRTLPNAAKWNITLQPQYRLGIGQYMATVGGNWWWQGPTNNLGGDPLGHRSSQHRFDLRLGVEPASGKWEVAVYGRDITNEKNVVGGKSSFQSKTEALTYDGGGVAQERGRRWGIQASYFLGN